MVLTNHVRASKVRAAVSGGTEFSRRQFVMGTGSLLALGAMGLPSYAGQLLGLSGNVPVLDGNRFDLHIAYQKVNFTGTARVATCVNGGLPGPTLRWKEGERVTVRVTNHLDEDTSIHWHGIILPSAMDGVPGMSFAGIKPGETFEYSFDVVQSGTYWYHSHSNFQEQTGLAGAIIIDPKTPAPGISYDREMLVMLSDWSDRVPAQIYAKLKKMGDYYNYRERTLGDTWRDLRTRGVAAAWRERAMWNRMRMSDRDIADVNGSTYTYLMNGITPAQGWLGLFKPGEKLLLRFINASGMSIFDVRIPGLKMTVVAADGQYVQPVTVDEFRIATAEVYDVLVEPEGDQAYCIFAQSNDRTGFALGQLTPSSDKRAPVPAMDPAPILNHEDMGMGTMNHGHENKVHQHHDAVSHDSSNHDHSVHGDSDHTGHGADQTVVAGDHSIHHMGATVMPGMDHRHMGIMDHSSHDMDVMDTPAMDHTRHGITAPLAKAGFGSNLAEPGGHLAEPVLHHASSEFGPQVDNRATATPSGLGDPGIGLREHARHFGRKVLTYADLRGLYPTYDKREPGREIELHLTGNMHRYMWSINGQNFMEAAPLVLNYGERVRIVLINDTMMTHPIHLHGMWSELETGDPDHLPRKHTVIVQPGSRISYLVTADAKGRWAYHCHLIYHMPGMMREVRVV